MHELDRVTLDEALAAARLVSKHEAWIRKVKRPVIRIFPSTMPASKGASRLGGHPDLPAGTPWPMYGHRPYRFLAQLQLAWLPAGYGLPNKGMLSLFVADDDEQTVFWQDPGYIRALYFPEPRDLERVTPPPEVDRETSWSIRFEEDVDLPKSRYQREDWPDAELPDALEIWWPGRGDRPFDQLLGYPEVSTLAYDPAPGPDWVLLLFLASHDELGWCWHDGDFLHVYVHRDALAKGDFSDIRADCG